MKKAKVIGKKEKKRNWRWLLLVLLLLLFLIATPMSTIPGFGRLAAMLGIPPEAMRHLTLFDLAAYSAGLQGNRVSAARDNYYLSAYGGGGGGLSPFGIISGGRLFNAREAYLKEQEANSKYFNSVRGSLSMAHKPGSDAGHYGGVAFRGGVPGYGGPLGPDGQPLTAPVIDPNRAGNGELGDMMGNPAFGSGDMGGSDGMGNGMKGMGGKGAMPTMPLPLNPRGPKQIIGAAGQQAGQYQALSNTADSFKGGRLGGMGGFNALVSRANNMQGREGQLGAFSSMADMGRAFYFSFNARGAGYKTDAKHIADAAFDGGEVEEETLIIPGEKPEIIVNTLEPPNTTINKIRGGMNACDDAEKAFHASIASSKKTLDKLFDALLAVGAPTPKKVPGCCMGTGLKKNKQAKKLRGDWNAMLPKFKDVCKEMKDAAVETAKICGLKHNIDKMDCERFDDLKLESKSWSSNVNDWWNPNAPKCWDNPLDRNKNSTNLNKVKQVYKETIENMFESDDTTNMIPGKW